jgi:LacI family transcriptional regulator
MGTITIKDVAKLLNISISTVSRAFNNKYDINPETRKMILEKCRQLGYSPNPIAKQLSTKKSYMVGIVVPEFINAFFPRVIMGIQRVMNEAGYQVLIMSSDESALKEVENLKALQKNNVDGVIVSLSQETRDVSYYQNLLEDKTPIVQINRVSQKLETPKVVFEDYKWARLATEHLISMGYKKIYHLAGPVNMIVSHNRAKGFTDMMREHELYLDAKQPVIEAGIFIEDGRKIAEQLIRDKNIPEAFFCFNDPIAIGAIEVFKEHGYRIPQDLAFVGFTESRLAAHLDPPLTSVEQPADEMGSLSAHILLDMINGKKYNSDTIVRLDGKLNIRQSSIRK